MRIQARLDYWTLTVAVSRIFLFSTFMTVAATIPILKQEWGLSATAAGSIITSFMIAYSVSLFAFAWAADHIGAKRTVAASAVASAAASLLFGLLAHDYLSAVLLYGLVGLAQGGIYTPLIMLFAERTAAGQRGAAMGWLIGSTSIGYAVSLWLSGLGLELGGWKAAFAITGSAPVLGMSILLVCLRHTKNRIHRRSGAGGLIGQIVHNGNARRLIIGYSAHNWELLGMWAWIPAFLAASFALGSNGTEATVRSGAQFSAVMHIIGAGAALTMGRLSDRLGRKRVLVGAALLAAVLSFSIGWMIASPASVVIAVSIVYGFSTLGDSPVLTTALTEVVDRGYLGAVLAVRSLLGFGTGAIAPLAFGGTIDLMERIGAGPQASWAAAFAVLGIGGAIAALLALRLKGLAE